MDTKALRQKILNLAIRGKLVPQDPNEEPASVLLEKIRAEKQQMVKDGRLKTKDIKNDTIIFKGEDNLHYEKFQDGSVKCIEDEIPFELPKGWEWCRVRDIAAVKGGKRLPKGVGFSPCRTAHAYIRVTDMKNHSINTDDLKYISEEVFLQIKNYTISKDDLYVTIAGTIGVTGEVPTELDGMNLTENAVKITNIQINKTYLCLIIQSEFVQQQFQDKTHQVAMPKLALERILSTLIPVCTITTQSAMVSKFVEMDSLINQIREEKEILAETVSLTKSKILDLAIRGKLVPQNPDDEPASVLLERIRAEKEELIKQGKIKRDKKESVIFKGEDNSYYETISNNTICIDEEVPFDLPDGWIWCRLKSLADPHENSFVDGPFGSNLKTDHYTDRREVRIIQLNNIGEFTWKNNGIKYTTYSHAETLSRCKSYPGDIVIAKMMPAGRAIIIPDIEDVYVISSDCVRLQLPNYIDKRYVMYMINSPTINKSVMKNVQGIGRTRTSLSKLKELLVPIPPYKQQCQISATFDKSLFYFDTINALCE
ncbi:restriction endonuclease subunit S [Eubacterium sp. MSJ-21]|nr:restriction endonuclease subunit S [Eubacterium sp. MSJ-21]